MTSKWLKILPVILCALTIFLVYANLDTFGDLSMKWMNQQHPGQNLSQEGSGFNFRPEKGQASSGFNYRPETGHTSSGYAVQINATCTQIKNLAFLKVHKTGSTTTSNLLRRFSIRNHLNTVLMSREDNYWILGSLKQVVPLPDGEYFNILDLDSVYDRKLYQTLLPHNQFYLGSLREPVSRYISFEFDGSFHGGVFRRNRSNVYMFEDPLAGDPRSLAQQMSVEFGLPQDKRRDDTAIREHLRKIDREFDFVIIREYYDESLVILRRLLCWQMKDIVYMIRNKNKSKSQYALSPTGRRKLEEQLRADVMFYEHFRLKLFNTTISLGVEFMQEVAQFRRVLSVVKDYCEHGVEAWPKVDIPANHWSPAFSVSKSDCELMKMVEAPMVKMMADKAMARYKAFKEKNENKGRS